MSNAVSTLVMLLRLSRVQAVGEGWRLCLRGGYWFARTPSTKKLRGDLRWMKGHSGYTMMLVQNSICDAPLSLLNAIMSKQR